MLKIIFRSRILTYAIFLLAIPGLAGAASKKELQEAVDKCTEEKAAVENRLSELEAQLATLNEKNTLLELQIKNQKAEIQELQAEVYNLPIEEYEALKKKVIEIQEVKDQIIATLDERMELKDKALEQLNEQKILLEQQIEKLKAELQRWGG